MEFFLRERLANYAHNSWSGWMRYLFSKGTFNEDGSWTMPVEFVNRWTRQMETDYIHLPEDEKESDRDEADKIISIVDEYS